MLPTHESKTAQHKFNGRKGLGDEVLELPIGIMQDNTQVSWLATRDLSPLPQAQQHALCMVLIDIKKSGYVIGRTFECNAKSVILARVLRNGSVLE